MLKFIPLVNLRSNVIGSLCIVTGHWLFVTGYLIENCRLNIEGISLILYLESPKDFR